MDPSAPGTVHPENPSAQVFPDAEMRNFFSKVPFQVTITVAGLTIRSVERHRGQNSDRPRIGDRLA